MFTLRLDDAINTMVQNFLRNSIFLPARRNTVMFMTVKLVMADDVINHTNIRETAVHFMFQTYGTVVLVGSQTSEKAVIPDHHYWKLGSRSGSADCSTAITRVLRSQEQELREKLCVDHKHPVFMQAEIFSVQFRETTSVNIVTPNRIELCFREAA